MAGGGKYASMQQAVTLWETIYTVEFEMSHNDGTPSYILMMASVHSADLGALYARESICGHYKSKTPLSICGHYKSKSPLSICGHYKSKTPSVHLWTLQI